MKKKFALFANEYHQNFGGINDFVCFSDTIEEAKQALDHSTRDGVTWAHIIDTDTFEKIWEEYFDPDLEPEESEPGPKEEEEELKKTSRRYVLFAPY